MTADPSRDTHDVARLPSPARHARRLGATFLAVLGAVFSGPASATAASPEDCRVAVDADGQVELLEGNSSMIGVRSQLGDWAPFVGTTLCLLSTGLAAEVTTGQDYDQPGVGADTSAGDTVSLRWELTAPADARGLLLRVAFFSREYPEWVGASYNDGLRLIVDALSYSGEMLFDSYGNPLTVNSAFPWVTAPSQLNGSGYESGGGTEWLATVLPVQPGESVTLTATLYEVADGVRDSAALIDGFEWLADAPSDLGTWPADGEGYPTLPLSALNLLSVDPASLPNEGGGELRLLGAGFDETTTVQIGPIEVDVIAESENVLAVVGGAPSAFDVGLTTLGGAANVQVWRGTATDSLFEGLTWSPRGPPEIESLEPGGVPAGYALDLVVVGSLLADVIWTLEAGDGTTTDLTPTQIPEVAGEQVRLSLPPLERGDYLLTAANTGGTDQQGFTAFVPERPDWVPPDEESGCDCGVDPSRRATLWPLFALLLVARFRRRRSARARAAEGATGRARRVPVEGAP